MPSVEPPIVAYLVRALDGAVLAVAREDDDRGASARGLDGLRIVEVTTK